jgi:hypothetical protein
VSVCVNVYATGREKHSHSSQKSLDVFSLCRSY